jgi:T5SS/PEP-CTERM-associated repeat protein
MKTVRIILVVTLLAALPLRAQIVNDGATATLSNVTTNITGSVTVGTNGAFTLLVLSDNTLLTNSTHSNIGRNATARSNEVQLISPTARWRMGGPLFVGSNGASSRLVVSNGALVENGEGSLGLNVSSSNNVALVTGGSSVWSNRNNLYIGSAASGNQMMVSNGGRVVNTTGVLGREDGSSNNLVLVTGSGSVWSNAIGLFIGNLRSPGNRLVIEAGGLASSESGNLGGSAGADNNEAVVTGAGSLWNSRFMTIGGPGSFNRLMVSNGAAVRGLSGSVGGTFSGGNQVVITGAGSTWTNVGLRIGEGGSGNRVDVSDGGAMVTGNGVVGFGTFGVNNMVFVRGFGSVWNSQDNLIIGDVGGGNVLMASNGATVLSSNATIGASSAPSFGLGNDNLALLTGAGTVWSNRNVLNLGDFGAGNQMVISNGAAVHVGGNSRIGGDSSARSNSVTVTGPGTKWTVGGVHLYVGSNAPFSRLVISNGARVDSSSISTLGGYTDGSNNQAVVTGPGSVWSNRFSLHIGTASDGNQLLIADGGQVHSGNGTIGLNNRRNQAVVTGTGSMWTMGGVLDVGVGGSQSELVVSNGGTVAAVVEATIGRFPNITSNNRLTVDGGTLRVTNVLGTGLLDVRGGTNVFNAGLIEVDQLVVTNRGEDFVPVEFENRNAITIPSGSPASPYPSTIQVAGMAGVVTWVRVTLFGLAHTFPDDVDILLVSPAGQKVMLMSDAGGGTDIIGNVLFFEDAAVATLPDETAIPFIGTYRPTDFQPGETMPGPAPAGPYSVTLSSFNGSSANGTWRLYINDDLNPNSGSISEGWGLEITTDGGPAPDRGYFEFNGGTLITRGAVISNGAPFIVGDSGANPAIWNVRASASNHLVSGDLIVGANSSFNQLILTNGALLTSSANSAYAILGQQFGANSNNATISGAGSRWVLDDGVFVGRFGSGNRLVISNGASLVTASSSLLGNEFQSTNNEAVVTGPGSSWVSGPGQMFVGYGGRGNRLLVSNGGVVASSFGTIGDSSADSSNNLAVVTGAGSVWSNAFDLRVGNGGAANQLIVSNSGTVSANNAVYVGVDPASVRNRLVVDGGTLRVTNVSAGGTLDVRRGTNVLNAGFVEVDRLLLTNAAGRFEFNGGTLSTRSTVVNNGQSFLVGNGMNAATFNLAGNGSHSFAAQLFVGANAALTGNGTISGVLVLAGGGTLAPGISIGKISLGPPPSLQGTVVVEISKNGTVITNDHIQVTAPLTYGGSLVVSNLGPDALAAGDRFRLFSANSFAGGFTNITLPALPPDLGWTNRLLVDGSIEVIVAPQPRFANIALSGTNVIISGTNGLPNASYAVLAATNVALPLSNWMSLFTNQFGAAGEFSLTNAIAPDEPQRFFHLRTP